ncbi:roadblock/LC7 domain-containing protein [Streptomyces sp. NPDC059506]|uniref:roadblock/LC7 domain-containing protein n=1 Tax=Streptomyces sp. NPDC059506 TaxID=3347751 RepID=UPI0036C04762
MTRTPPDMTWALNRLAENPGALFALLFSGDGLVMAKSDKLSKDDADSAAAALSGIQSLSRGLSRFCGAEALKWGITVIELGTHSVLVTAAGQNSCLAVSVAANLASPQMTIVSEATAKTAAAMSEALSAAARTDGSPAV